MLAEVVSFAFAVIILGYTSGFVLLADKDDQTALGDFGSLGIWVSPIFYM